MTKIPTEKIVCPDCGTTIQYTEKDMYSTLIICPKCGEVIPAKKPVSDSKPYIKKDTYNKG